MKTVKNISTKSLAIPNVGIVEPNETATVPDTFNNPNFKPVKEVENSGQPQRRGGSKNKSK